MNNLNFYAAISRFGALNYRAKIMVVAFLGTHIPLLAIVGFYVMSTTSDMGVVWGTLLVGLIATLVGTGVTLFVLNALLQPVLLTSKQLRTYRESREIMALPTNFKDEAGTLMSDATKTLTRLEETLVELETVDAVTGLANRDKFVSQLHSRMSGGTKGSVMVLRLGNVARLATTYDQAAANNYVQHFSGALSQAAGHDTIIARIDSGAFAILSQLDAEPASAFAAGLLTSLSKPIGVAGIDVMPDLSVGIALFPDDSEGAEALLDAAVAAAAMGRENSGVMFHSVKARNEARERYGLEQELRQAIKHNDFELHFQPVVDTRHGGAVGAEALIRWQHPDRGLIMPGLFIPAAERSSLINDIGIWVMREACAQAGRWQVQGLGNLKVAINLSARQFLDPHLIDLLSEALDAAKVSGDKLEIELTESSAMLDADYTRKVFGKINDLGVSIAIDDFGTGYASMSYLRKLPFDKLKIDREFVANVDTSTQSQAIVNAMIALGHGLRLKVLAEGTERAEEVQYLTERGCDLFQGYYFSKPVAAASFPKVVADLGLRANAA